ncbi:MAG TPA: SAM-dependent methyltransferase [Clostridiales bacterium]|nr:SAM-dependent methyltransferase [Clostridiales bacterium]
MNNEQGEDMLLSPRLKAIADLVPPSRTIADIGTDHGHIPLYLIRQGRAEYAIAADISPGSLDKAVQLIQQYNMGHCMEARLGSGLSVIAPGEADTIIIAGMGGILIREILEEGEEAARSAHILILQPMIGQEELRRWLLNNGYSIVDEELAAEGDRIYEIIAAKPDKEARGYENEIYYDIGWKLVEKKHPLLKEWIQKKIRSLSEIVRNLGNAKTQSASERKHELMEKIRMYKEVYDSCFR